MDQGQSPRLVDHLIDIITITICAVICNADTIRRVFMRLKPQQVQSSFLSWVRALRRTQGGAGLMEIEGCIVTIDAIGTQKKIAQRIREGKADYVRALKADQSALHENVKLHLDDALARNFHDVPYDSHTTVEKDHGRFEKRQYWVSCELSWLCPMPRGSPKLRAPTGEWKTPPRTLPSCTIVRRT